MPARFPTRSARPLLLALLAVVLQLSVARPSCGQAKAGGGEPPQAALPAAPAPAGPDTTIWIDDAGAPRPVLGVSYDEFARAWRALREGQQGEPTPRYVISSVAVEGEEKEGYATLDVVIELQLNTDQRVEAPLGFGRSILAEQPTGLAEADTFGYSEPAESYAVTLSGRGPRTMRLSLMTPLRASGQTNELTLTLPRALQSLLRLRLAGRATDPSVTDGAILTVEELEAGPRLTVRGGVGQVRLRWRSPERAEAASQTVLSATGEVSNQIDGGSVRSTARLTVRSFGGEFESFRVRLPDGAKRIQPDAIENEPYRVIDDATGETCTVLLPDKTTGPVTVTLNTERAVSDASTAVDLAGFEVLDTVRQYGYQAVTVDEDTQLHWNDLVGARRVAVEELPEGLASDQPGYAVRYFRQNYRIPVEVWSRDTRIEASTSYELEIQPDAALLHVTTRYQIMGAPVLGFSFDLNDWRELTADQIEPAEHIDLASLYQYENGVLDIPLARPQSGNVTVTFHARKYLPTDGGELDFVLPKPTRPALDAVSRVELTILVDPSLRLTLAPQTEQALTPVVDPPPARAAGAPEGGEVLRFREKEHPVFAFQPLRFQARLSRRPGEVHAASHAVVTVLEDRTSVEQQVEFDILRQPRESVELSAPADLLSDPTLSVSLASDERGAPAPPALEWSVNASTGRIIANLPRPWIGPLRLAVSYSPPGGRVTLSNNGELRTPLAAPAGAATFTQTVAARSDAGAPLTVAPGDSGWVVNGEPQESGEVLVTSAFPVDALRLAEAADRVVVQPEAQITRVWRQSWRRGGTLQERSCWRMLSTEDAAYLILPDGVPAESLAVWVDGRRVVAEPVEAPLLRVPLVPSIAGAATEHTIEARRVQALPNESGGPTTLRPVGLRGDASQATCYWQVILPADSWLISAPEDLRAAWRVDWDRGRFRRLPAKSTAELEAWVGAEQQDLALSATERVYLFSALTLPEREWRLQTVNQNLTVLFASLATLAVGLLISYAPGGVRKVAVIVATVAILLAAYFWPAELTLAVQAGGFGVVALFTAWIAMLTLAPRTKPVVDLSGDSTSIRRSSTDIEAPVSLAAGTVSTNAPTVSLELGGKSAH